jgi:sortase A
MRTRTLLLAVAVATILPASAAAQRPVGRIVIPRIGLNAAFFNGQSAAATSDGPAHYPWTGMPGHRRTVGIAGHRVTHTHPFLRLAELRHNDLIAIRYGRAPAFRRVACYRFVRSRVVSPADVTVLRDLGFDRLVLTTCTPPGRSTYRLAVFARRVARC